MSGLLYGKSFGSEHRESLKSRILHLYGDYSVSLLFKNTALSVPQNVQGV